MGDTDPLFELRNLFLIGNYQAAINEGLTLDHLPEAHKVDRDVIIYRAYIAKGDYNLVLEEIKDSSPHAGLVAVKALASYLSSERNKDIVLTTIKSWPSDPRMVNNDTVQLVSGLIAFYEENYDEVFRTLHQSTSLEGRALLVRAFIQIDRLDLAQKELGTMQNIDDDATATQLATAWLDIALGGEKLEEAFFILTELADKWNATPLLLNGLASVHLKRLDKPDEARNAEKVLLQAMEKNPNDVDTLVNLVALYQHMGKSKEVINRYLNQAKARTPKHPYVKELELLEQSWERLVSRFSPTQAS
jgi:coatomer protein complex subunit epsilon